MKSLSATRFSRLQINRYIKYCCRDMYYENNNITPPTLASGWPSRALWIINTWLPPFVSRCFSWSTLWFHCLSMPPSWWEFFLTVQIKIRNYKLESCSKNIQVGISYTLLFEAAATVKQSSRWTDRVWYIYNLQSIIWTRGSFNNVLFHIELLREGCR